MAVAQAGSTTAAAHAIALSQSATSAALNELESALGGRLFDRVGKRLLLNDNGRLLLPQARQLVDAARTIEQQFAPDAHGGAAQITIGASTTIGSYLLPGLLAACRAEYGAMPARVAIANTADIAAAVARFEVDLGFIEGPCHEPGLHVEPWIEDELIIACAPQHPLAAQGDRKITARMLRDVDWLLREPGSGTREGVEQALVPHLHALRPACEFSNSEAITRAAAAGLGVCCLSRWVVDDMIRSGRLVALRTGLPRLRRRFYLIVGERKLHSPALARLLRFSRAWLPPA